MRTLLLCLATLTCAAVDISIDDPGIRRIGFFTADGRCAWTGCGFEAGFTGTSVTVRIQGNKAWYAASVDGGEPVAFELRKGQTEYPVAEGLAAGEHRIALFKRTEGHSGIEKPLGLRLDDGAKAYAIPAPERRLTIMGDSITCGYGNEAAKPEEGFTLPQENGWETYWAIAARNLKADIRCIAFSGKGIWRNRGKNDSFQDTMPVLWHRALPFDPSSTIDHATFVPDVHIVNLGTNDIAIDEPPRDPFVAAVLAHIADVRTTAPKAQIIFCLGPMLNQKQKDLFKGHYQAVIDQSKDPTIHLLDLGGQKFPEGVGGHWHPSVVTHREMAVKLEAKLKEITGW